MLLAMIAALGPALTRTFILVLGLKIRDPHLPVESALVLAALVYTWQKRRRLDWVLLVGGALLITTQATRRLVGRSEVCPSTNRGLAACFAPPSAECHHHFGRTSAA
jgi:hypothetical protein